MKRSILQRLFARDKKNRPERSILGISGGDLPESGVGRIQQTAVSSPANELALRPNCLFAFVDLKDPFATGEIAEEELPGPILSVMSAKQFAAVYLFYTPHVRENARLTQKQIAQRFPECRVTAKELFVSDPKGFSGVMGALAGVVRWIVSDKTIGNVYVCVSSGTAEMRAAWFLLTSLGVLPATLLQVGFPARPLSGAANVKEVQIGTTSWQVLRELAMPAEYFSERSLHSYSAPDETEGSSVSHEPTEEFFGDVPESLRKVRPRGARRVSTPVEVEPASWSVPGLEEGLQELGIHVGSATLRHAAEQAGIAAASHLPVLLLGETGTGKERFAHLVHRLSPRFSRELVAINCAAIPETLAESYLFGHIKGAFSDAHNDKKGMFESADGGTLFLDEVAELNLEVQAKLLRTIQDGVILPLGSTTPRKVDVRIVAATNRDLKEQVGLGRFREDLYFRLEVVEIKLPALRDRSCDVPELALALLRQINQRRSKPRQLSKEALLVLERHDWPGNIRELSNVLERSVLFSVADVVGPEDLRFTKPSSNKEVGIAVPEPHVGFSIEGYLGQVRQELFRRALELCKQNQAEAATLLGVSKQAVSKFVLGNSDNRS